MLCTFANKVTSKDAALHEISMPHNILKDQNMG